MAISNAMLTSLKWPQLGGVAIFSPDNVVRVVCGPAACDPRLPVLLGPRLAATAPLNSLVLLRQVAGPTPSLLAVRVCTSFFDSKHAARVTLGVAHAKRNIALSRTCNELLSRLKCNFRDSAHHVFGLAGSAGNECADAAASLGMRGLISETNDPSF